MKDASATIYAENVSMSRMRAVDFLELTKPRVGFLVLFTVAAGAFLGAGGAPDVVQLVHTILGTALVVAGASALNQFLERHSDALMTRTENRPLPAGRLRPNDVLGFGLALGAAGLIYLLAVHQTAAAIVAGIAFASYVFVYTPLKRITSLNTLVGAVPGALPPVIGWTAATGTFDKGAATLFTILFLWQVPHFLAIAWIYREDYARAGLQMLPVVDREGKMTGRQMVNYCLALIPASLTPALVGLGGPIYLAGALMLGLGFLWYAIGFRCATSLAGARRVLRASLIYLPALFALLLMDGGPLRGALAWWH